MIMKKQGSIFRENYERYMRQIKDLDFSKLALKLGLEKNKDQLIIPFFNKRFRVDQDGIWTPNGDMPLYSECVVIAKYLILCPEYIPPFKQWVTYKDFKDAAPFAGAFTTNVEKSIAKRFANKLGDLKEAGLSLGGRTLKDTGLSYELIMEFDVLPMFRLLLVFNDQDEEFPPEAKVLFPDNSDKFLDMECLAISGWLLSDYLYLACGGSTMTIM